MKMRNALAAVIMPFAAATLMADIRITSPREGETVPQLWPEQIAFLEMSREQRKNNREKGDRTALEALKARKGRARPVEIAWTGSDGVCQVMITRLPDGKVFHTSSTTGTSVSVSGRLEIARKWKATVSDGTSSASVTFSTEDRAPRIITLDGVGNARDLGGRIGLDGRRVKQGLVFRTGGLNRNANAVYYTYDEILKLHEEGKLATAGTWRSRHLGREYEARLSSGKGIDKTHLRLFKHGPTAPGEERLSDADRAYLLGFLGIKSDIDFRTDWECYGMTGSPLGDDVYWYHYMWVDGYGGFITPNGRASTARALSVFINPKSYPIDFHCIGGTDRTGTFAFMLNAFLGVDEEELVRDYEMSFIGGGGVDALHYRWLEGMLKSAHELPGDTLADKFKRHFLSLGFSEEALNRLREFLLEPKPSDAAKMKAKKGRLGARIVPVDPLLDQVDAKEGRMTFFWNAEPAVPGGSLSVVVDGKFTARARLGEDRRATVRLGELAPGEHDILVKLKSRNGDRIARNNYKITAVAPQCRTAGRKLNNFVVEMLNEPLVDGEIAFDNPRKGWVFIGFIGAQPKACAMLDGGKEPVVRHRPEEPMETMRWLDAGTHRLTVKGASGGGRLVVRLVKPLKITARSFSNGAKTSFSLKRNYSFDFFRRYLMSAFNTYTIGEEWRLNSATGNNAAINAELQARGRLAMAAADVRPAELELRADPESMRRKLALSAAYRDGLPLEMDENKINAPAEEMDAFAEAVWELASDRSNRAMFSDYCDVPGQALTNLTAQVSAISAALNTGRGHGMLVPEIYLGAKRTEEGRDNQESRAIAFIESLRAAMPSAPSHTIHLMSGWLTMGSWSSYSSCEIDIKALYDHYIRRLATDPAFHDVGGVGMSTLACDEEVARWTARLVRHYCIEGRTDSLADSLGYRYRPEIVKDGDFMKGFEYWTAHPAARDSLRDERIRGYGGKKGQYRMGRDDVEVGEHFALFTRSADAPNRLEQRVSGLTPGKLYSLTYCTADYDDVCEPGMHPTDGRLVATFDAADAMPELSYEWEAPDQKRAKLLGRPPHCITVTHRMVFRATRPEGVLAFSDWKDASSPGGEAGRRRMLNYVSIKPYYVESEEELSQLRLIGQSR